MEKEIAAVMTADGLALKGKKVLLKPNFVETHPERPINTNPVRHRLRSLTPACGWERRRSWSVKPPGHRRDPWFSVLNPKLSAVLDKRVRCLDLNHGDATMVPNKGGLTRLPAFYLAQACGRSRRAHQHAQDEDAPLGGRHSLP